LNYPWNWSVYWELSPDGRGTYLHTLIEGLGWTLAVALCAWILALGLGLLIGVCRTLPNRAAQTFASAWVDLFRNVPLLVQIFLWYFVFPEVVPQTVGNFLKHLPSPYNGFIPATLGLALFTSARIAEQVRAGIQSIPAGQSLAGKAMGLTLAQTYRYVLLPVALRVIIPPLTSEFMNTIKNSSVALTVGVLELTAAARSMQEFSFQTFEAFTAATIIYVLVNLCVAAGMRVIESRAAIPGHSVGAAGR